MISLPFLRNHTRKPIYSNRTCPRPCVQAQPSGTVYQSIFPSKVPPELSYNSNFLRCNLKMVYLPAAVLVLFPVREIKYPDHTLQPRARRIYFTNDSKLQSTLAGEVKAAGTGNSQSHSQSRAERTELCRITLWSAYSPHFYSAQDTKGMLDYVKLTNPTLQPPRHLIVVFIWEAHATAGDAYSLLECPKRWTLALPWFLLNLLPLLGQGLCTEDVSEKERFRLLGRWLGSCASVTAATLHVIIQNTCDNEKKKDKQNTKFKAAHRRKADDPSTGLLGTGYASDPLNGAFHFGTNLLGTFPKCSISQYKSFI